MKMLLLWLLGEKETWKVGQSQFVERRLTASQGT